MKKVVFVILKYVTKPLSLRVLPLATLLPRRVNGRVKRAPDSRHPLSDLTMVVLLQVLVFILGFVITGQRADAAENIAWVEVSKDDIPKLVIDPSREVAAYKLIPQPTPAPLPSDKDNRSWTKSPYHAIIAKVAEKYQFDPQLIYAIIMTESEGDELAFRYEPYIKDASLCMGQILINTARTLGFAGEPKALYNPTVCIDLIGKYLRKLIEAHGELTPIQLATAYNTGSPYRRPVRGHIFRFKKWLNETS